MFTYCIRIQGILMQFAAATATSGTKRPKIGLIFLVARLSESAVAKAPPVARQ